MKIIAIYFQRKPAYKKMARVFENSLVSCMPAVKYEIVKIKHPKNIDHKRDCAYAFLAAANRVLREKELTIVCDIDLLFLKPILDIANFNFDIAVTVRKSIPYNTGLWAYRPTARARQFIEKWIYYTHTIMKNFCKYEGFSWDNGGIDQASLKWTMDKNQNNCIATVKELDCQEWNATQSEWKLINNKTRVIHYKSKLRKACFKDDFNYEKLEYLKPLVRIWRDFL
jgi:hypothetical protein